jgi:hypothetical protein
VSNLELRQQAAQATLDHFQGKSFSFADGNDCAKMALFCLRKLGVRIPIAKAGSYKTVASARAALKRLGVNSLPELMDKYFERIPPASALPADLIELPGRGASLGALSVFLGFDVALVFHEDTNTAVAGRITYEPGAEPLGAWRTLPL